jgi:hypothetical protein
MATSDTCKYVIEAIDANGNQTGDWEVGIGTYSGTNQLTRTTVEASSNANAAVTLSAGTKRVMLDASAALLNSFLKNSNNLSDLSSASTARSNLGLAIGSNVQAWDADLDALAGLSGLQGDIIYRDGTQWQRLGAGTAGQLLKTGGSGANPSWTDPALIAEQSPSGTGTVTFSSIPATYRDLIVVCRGRGTNASTAVNVLVRLNSDSGANYDRQYVAGANSSATAQASVAATDLFASAISIAAASATSGVASALEITIYDYKGTTFQKAAHATQDHKVGTTTASLQVAEVSGFWRNTAAVTQIDLVLSAGNYASGTVVSLYGRL